MPAGPSGLPSTRPTSRWWWPSGRSFRAPVLDVPPRGSINVHASLLPRYRGAAPIAWAIIRGERETGITTFQMDAGMDTGPLLLQRPTAIGAEETAGELAERLAVLGAEVLLETLARLQTLTPRPQDSAAATLAPRLRKEDGLLDWTEPAAVPGGAGTRAEPVARGGHPRARRPPADLAGARDRGPGRAGRAHPGRGAARGRDRCGPPSAPRGPAREPTSNGLGRLSEGRAARPGSAAWRDSPAPLTPSAPRPRQPRRAWARPAPHGAVGARREAWRSRCSSAPRPRTRTRTGCWRRSLTGPGSIRGTAASPPS